jgi:predicted RNase H-like HicB family nuclease
VPATQDTDTVAHYLDLPYTVAVHSQGEGKQATWSATVEELSGCAAQGRSPDEAVERLRGAMESWFEAALAQRRKIPVPAGQTVKQRAASSTHSGRFLVRMPGVLHAELAQAAEREQLSLNRFVTNALAAVVSPSAASAERRAPGPRREPGSAQAPSRAFRIALAANAALVVIAAVAAVVLLVLALHSGV